MQSKFVSGSIPRHLLTMMFASWVALASGMLLSLADMYFLSRLNDVDVLAAIGFSGSIAMFPMSVGIGFSIAISVLVSQALSRKGRAEASYIFSAILSIALALSLCVAAVLIFNLTLFLSVLGADGRVQELARSYLLITLCSAPLSVLLMAFASGLRSLALAKASMWVSLLATAINFILDPIFIEVLEMGIEGAAWATVVARIIAVCVGLYYLIIKMQFVAWVSFSEVKQVFSTAKKIALPAVISNLFTPLGGVIVVSVASGFGTEAMAGIAVVGSLSPILFSVYFSLTGAAGPMIGQNIGAAKPERVGYIYRYGLLILSVYTLIIWLGLMLAHPFLLELFQLSGLAGDLLKLYCFVQVPLSFGLGCIALSNAIYNNLSKPHWSMWLNASRSSIVTYVFCHVGAFYYGVFGAVMASSLSFIVFGVLGVLFAITLYRREYPELKLLT